MKSNLKKREVSLSEVNWVEALGDCAKLVTGSASVATLSATKAFEKELPSDRFLRIHKSHIDRVLVAVWAILSISSLVAAAARNW